MQRRGTQEAVLSLSFAFPFEWTAARESQRRQFESAGAHALCCRVRTFKVASVSMMGLAALHSIPDDPHFLTEPFRFARPTNRRTESVDLDVL